MKQYMAVPSEPMAMQPAIARQNGLLHPSSLTPRSADEAPQQPD